MTAYTFVLQLELVQCDASGEEISAESLCVATGTVEGSSIVFEIDDDVWDRGFRSIHPRGPSNILRATSMATRRSGGFLECARLFRTVCEDADDDGFTFELDDVPRRRDDTAFTFAMKLKREQNVRFEPDVDIAWRRNMTSTVLRAQFRHFANDARWQDMDADEVPVFLDQWVEWSRS